MTAIFGKLRFHRLQMAVPSSSACCSPSHVLREQILRAETPIRVFNLLNQQERDANFAQKKAERATVRSHFRDKYRLPKNELDETQIQAAADDVELPTELAKMIAEDNQEEEQKQSVLGHLTNIQNVDMGHLKGKAQATLEDLKNSAEKCSVM
uniref:Complexin 3 n=1 Tax=Sinocyclocheilus grahami TaxID=75366 RepID=A0A672N6R9_SINGR